MVHQKNLQDGKGPERALCVGALALRLGVTPSAVSQHLAVLRAVGLVTDERRGNTVHYRLLIPESAGDRITLRARVNHRKFSWWNTQWSFAGVRDPRDPEPAVGPGYDDGHRTFTGDTSHASGKRKGIPTLPITVMAEAEATLRVAGSASRAGDPKPSPALRGRWNDYGIGLLLLGDLKAAEAAFLRS